MELTPKQQIVELVSKSQKILILTHVNPDGDALGSTLALFLALKKLGKDVLAYCQDVVPQALKFLPENNQITNDFQNQRDFIISIDTSNTKVDRLGYKQRQEENKLDIIITPKDGELSEKNVTFQASSTKFDLIFILDSSEIERVGKIYEENSNIFYEVPIINIDHHAGNDYFGRVNWVELAATSTAEILVSFLESLGREKSLFDPEIATALLTGIITDTGSFQHGNTTPKSFTVAAQLVAAGGRQQEIVQHIFRTKPLSTLKLWGKILSNINEESKHRFVWSKVEATDYLNFNAQESETAGVADELLKTVPNIDFALLFSERQNGLNVSLRGVGKSVNVAEIARLFNGGGHELAAAFQIPNTSFEEGKEMILIRIKEFQAKRLGFLNNELNNIDYQKPTNNYLDNEYYQEDKGKTDQNEVPLDQIEVT